MKRIFLLLCFALCLCSCSSAVRYVAGRSGADNDEKTTIEKLRDDNIDPTNFKPLETEYGIASYYADKYNGRKTASGEIYNMYGISAAHINYPLGTIVKVTNLDNNLSLILTINDRMPDIHNRIIDLSYGAAEKLDMIKKGTANVKIEVIKWGDNSSN
jgi:peptidoglycan lytic transglycosylase